ncbi:MAG TPA: TldD/PmbA family protein, partial [Thermococcus paralvinellae]|nr:TldD/PmbA family protein [Thermococcus paralvinellae]
MEGLVRYGEKFFDELEIAIYRNRSVGVNIELNEVSTSSVRQRTITVIRGIKDKRIGISIIDSEDEEEIRKAIEEAYKMAKLNAPDEKWVSLPGPGKYKEPKKVGREIKDVSPDYFVGLATKAIELALEKDRGFIVAGGGGGAEWSESLIVNSHGVDVFQEGGGAYFYLELI